MGRRDAIVVRVDPGRGTPERRRYEPRSDGRWDEFDEEWSGCTWRIRGHRIVERAVVAESAEVQ